MPTRYIDADIMRKDWLEHGENECVYDTNAILDSIDSQPTADVVEVVRCKDCIYYEPHGRLGKCTSKRHLGIKLIKKPDDFCSQGERREQNEE